MLHHSDDELVGVSIKLKPGQTSCYENTFISDIRQLSIKLLFYIFFVYFATGEEENQSNSL